MEFRLCLRASPNILTVIAVADHESRKLATKAANLLAVYCCGGWIDRQHAVLGAWKPVFWISRQLEERQFTLAVEDQNGNTRAFPAQEVEVDEQIGDAAAVEILPDAPRQGRVIFGCEVEKIACVGHAGQRSAGASNHKAGEVAGRGRRSAGTRLKTCEMLIDFSSLWVCTRTDIHTREVE
jgi:hypothetical protein